MMVALKADPTAAWKVAWKVHWTADKKVVQKVEQRAAPKALSKAAQTVYQKDDLMAVLKADQTTA